MLAARLGDSGGKTGTVSYFLGDRVGPKTQKQGGVNLTDICKIRFLMAGTQRLVFACGRRPGGARRKAVAHRAAGPREAEKNGREA